MNLTENLNTPQKQAVLHTEGPLLILAGAGSGKTRVLTHRIAYLIQEKGVRPWNILAITFTNKAAKEMKERVQSLCGPDGDEVMVSTFHSFCLRILRREIEHLQPFTRGFTVYDADDQDKLMTACIRKLGLAEKSYPSSWALNKISKAKDRVIGPDEYVKEFGGSEPLAAQIAEIYRTYQDALAQYNALDFDDLIIKALELFYMNPDVLEYYAQRYRYIHVDEYQDTNYAQYMLVRTLSMAHHNLCVVGDDDQSIYAWRGADIRNILEFEKDFKDAAVIYLEQNYRSTGNILEAANQVIAHNTGRKPKKLWTESGKGDPIQVMQVNDERMEAEYVAARILDMVASGEYRRADIAVLYRLNAQSRALEGAFVRHRIPYRVFGGLKFYARKEVKDIMAYLRLMVNPNDEISLRRIINVPKRGIGETSVNQIFEAAANNADTAMGLILDEEKMKQLLPKVYKKVAPFGELIARLLAFKEMMPLQEFAEHLIEETGIGPGYEADQSEDAKGRLENIQELLGAIGEFAINFPEATLEDYLDNVALISDLDNLDEGQSAVTLMTLHSAKGLEFPVVFLCGMEDGIFPHLRMNSDEEANIEEERRLCYVGMTRARERLILVYAQLRTLFGFTRSCLPSRFLQELPESCLAGGRRPRAPEPKQDDLFGTMGGTTPTAKRGGHGASAGHGAFPGGFPGGGPSTKKPAPTAANKPADISAIKPGIKVQHKLFGTGRVIGLKGEGAGTIAQVAFEGKGIKNLALSMAPLDVVEES